MLIPVMEHCRTIKGVAVPAHADRYRAVQGSPPRHLTNNLVVCTARYLARNISLVENAGRGVTMKAPADRHRHRLTQVSRRRGHGKHLYAGHIHDGHALI